MARSDSVASTILGSDLSGPPSPTDQRSRSSALTTISATGSGDALIPQANAATPRTPTFVAPGLQAIRENKQGDTVEGWPLLAKLMAKHPDFEAFPRYKELYVKNLLYYQVELASIKERLEIFEKSDRDLKTGGEANFHRRPETMLTSDSDQRDEVLKLRATLDGYSKALIQYAKVSALPEPSTQNMNTLVRWLQSPNAGNYTVDGCGSEVWETSNEASSSQLSRRRMFLRLIASMFKRDKVPTMRPDLVAPCGQKSVDGFTRWIAEQAIPFWYLLTHPENDKLVDGTGTKSVVSDVEKMMMTGGRTGKGREANGEDALEDLKLNLIKSYSGSALVAFTSKITTLFACMVPMLAILVLSTAHNLSVRLGLIAAFTAVFCGLVTIMTEATRVQVFTASSAFLAVLVVFVQSQ